MKKFKKLIVALVVAGLMLSMVSVGFAAAPADVQGKDCEQAVSNLSALDILAGFPDGTFKPDEPVTRAQMAKIAVLSLGLGDVASASKVDTKFPDVKADHWAAGYINVAVDQGLLKGYPDGTFKPNNNVTYAEMLAIEVRALGYEPAVKGVWPTNYISKAADLDLTDDITFTANAAATRGDVAIVANASLDVFLMEQTGWGDSATYAVTTKTLIEDKLKATVIEDEVVDDVWFDAISSLNKGEISIGGTVYDLDDSIDAKALMGLTVTAWVNDDNVVFNIAETNAGDIKTFAWDDYTVSVSDGTITFTDADGNNTDYDLADSIVLVNGFDISNVTPDAVPVESDSTYSIIVKDKKVTYVKISGNITPSIVEEVKNDVVSFLNDSDIDFADLDYVMYKDGVAIEYSDLEPLDMLYVYPGEKYFEVANEVVSGTLNKVYTDKVTIGSTKYDVDLDVARYATDGTPEEADDTTAWNTSVTNLLGENVVALLDARGEVVLMYGNAVADTDTYAVVADEPVDASAGYDTIYKIKLFTESGEIATYKLDDTFVDDNFGSGKTYATFGAFDVAFDKGDIVKFGLTADSEIDAIEEVTPATVAEINVTTDAGDDQILKYNRFEIAEGSYKYFASNVKFYDINSDDTDDWTVTTKQAVADSSDNVAANYITDADSGRVTYFFVTSGSLATDDDTVGIYVDQYTNVDDDVVYTFFVDGELKDYVVNGAGTATANALYILTLNSKGELTGIAEPTVGNSVDIAAGPATLGADPLDGDILTVDLADGSAEWLITADTKIFKADGDSSVMLEKADLEEGDLVYVYEDSDNAYVAKYIVVVDAALL